MAKQIKTTVKNGKVMQEVIQKTVESETNYQRNKTELINKAKDFVSTVFSTAKKTTLTKSKFLDICLLNLRMSFTDIQDMISIAKENELFFYNDKNFSLVPIPPKTSEQVANELQRKDKETNKDFVIRMLCAVRESGNKYLNHRQIMSLANLENWQELKEIADSDKRIKYYGKAGSFSYTIDLL